MDFLNSLANKSKDVAGKAKKLAEVTGLNAQVAAKESEMKTVYAEIGKKVYQKKAAWKDVDFSVLFGKLEGIEAEIAKLREEIRTTKGVTLCANCGAELDMEVSFCPKCGIPVSKAEESAEETEDEAEVIDVEAKEVAAEQVVEESKAEPEV